MIFVMIINLFAVRITLKELGVEDYGIYNVVAGLTSMLTCVSSVLSMATQRYYSYYLGTKDFKKLNEVFSTSLNIYILLSIIILLLGTTLGTWFVHSFLNIPFERLSSANVVFIFSLIIFVLTILNVPFSAAIIAHEDMDTYAVISLLDAILKFISILCLCLVKSDKLICYGIFLLIAQFVTLSLYVVFSCKRYEECKYQFVKDLTTYRNLLSFSGWTFFGSIANVGMIHVNTILVNVFFGPIVNSARAISIQVYNAFTSLCNGFIMAIRPPMIKSYAENDYDYLLKFFYLSNKFIFYAMIVIGIPIYIEMEYILRLWLGNVDNNSIIFSKLILIYAIIISLHNPITIIVQATGVVKQYYVSVETFTLLCVPATYVFYKNGFNAEWTIITMIVLGFVAHFVRLICLKKQFQLFSFKKYIFTFIVPALMVSLIVFTSTNYICSNVKDSFFQLILSFLLSLFLTVTLLYFVGFSRSEKAMINDLLKRFIKFKQ